MHFEILVEGQSDLTAISILMKNLIGGHGDPHTWKIHKHRGIGRIPPDPATLPNRYDRTLLHNLPSRLRAYGSERRDDLVVVVLVDLDDRPSCQAFKNEMVSLLGYCHPRPRTQFRIAIAEIEAWFLGDVAALKRAYPTAKQEVLNNYIQDSQCPTWETLADAIYPGGMHAIRKMGKRSPTVLDLKRVWASQICPHMDPERNESHSFKVFRDGLWSVAAS